MLAMRWAWVDTGRPIGGPRRASGVDVRQAQPWADHTQSPWCPLLMEQETKEYGLIRRALSSLFVTGFGCRPNHWASNDHGGCWAGVRKPPVKETAGEWAPLSAGAMGVSLAGTVQRVSAQEA